MSCRKYIYEVMALNIVILLLSGCRSAVPVEVSVCAASAYESGRLHTECYLKPKQCEVDGFGMDSADMLPVHAFVVIENRSPFGLAIGAQEFSIGYSCLELDVDVRGSCYHARKNSPTWYRNLPEIEVLAPGSRMVLPVVFDPRVWDRIPSAAAIGSGLRMRPVLKGVEFLDGDKPVWPYETPRGVIEGEWARLDGVKRIVHPSFSRRLAHAEDDADSDVDVEVDFK